MSRKLSDIEQEKTRWDHTMPCDLVDRNVHYSIQEKLQTERNNMEKLSSELEVCWNLLAVYSTTTSVLILIASDS